MAAAKKAQAEAPTPSRDPIIGRRVRVLRGVCAGKEGKAVNAYRGRVATPDRVMVKIDGSGPGWLVSALPEDIEVVA